jgi:class 3 adenylate cyclase
VLGALIVVLIVPLPSLHQRVSPWVHRKLFPERERFESAMRVLRRDLSDCAGSQELFKTLGDRMRQSVELESLAIYAPTQDVHAAAYAHGPLVPPAFASEGRLLHLIEITEGPVSKTEWRRWARRGLIDASERASLEALSAEWLIPARRAEDLDTLVCIGPKASGDLFTRSEATLFEGVAERAVIQLDRFDREDRTRRDTRLIGELRRYVPASVERLIEHGDRPEAGEREVSIFFGDLRGSTAWAETRADEEVFEMIDRFTQRAASIVEQHRGTVVEFAGDGFMAVFGAFAASDTRERDALAAGRAILEAVSDGMLPAEQLPERPIGVGIATGKAFVGDVHIGSHVIWTALGDTANLAARLETMTKEVEATIVIDERTFRGAGDEAAGFESLGRVEIRGRAQPEPLYALCPVGRASGS